MRFSQWTKAEQHDLFCFFLEGQANEYYTLLLEVCPRLRFRDILKKFDKRFCTSAPDLTHQLNFHSASQNSYESQRESADRVLLLATRAFPQLPDIHTHAIPRLCYGAENVDAGLYALNGNPKTVEEALDRCSFTSTRGGEGPLCMGAVFSPKSIIISILLYKKGGGLIE